MQRWLNSLAISKLPVHPAAAAYRVNRSIFDNASVHAGSKYLLRMDCEDFFPSITESDIRLLVESRSAIFSEWDKYDVELFCKLVCRDQRLAIGSPSSPGLSNAICYDMDSQLADLSGKQGGDVHTLRRRSILLDHTTERVARLGK